MQIICARELQQYRYIANDNCNSLSCGIFCTVQAIPRSIVCHAHTGYGCQWSLLTI